MKKIGIMLGCVVILVGMMVVPGMTKNEKERGFDEFGYNYNANIFNGSLDGADRVWDGTYWGDDPWIEEFDGYRIEIDVASTHLIMKWNDYWFPPEKHDGKGPEGGWLTNHFRGTYTDEEGNQWKFNLFYKIVYTGPGSPLWGNYTVIQTVFTDNNPATDNGLISKEIPTGLGFYTKPI